MPGKVEGDGRDLRLFVGLQLDAETAAALHAFAVELGAGRPVPVANLHVTLAFLGAVPSHAVGDVGEVVRTAMAGSRRPRFTAAGWRTTGTVGMVLLEDEGGRAGALATAVRWGLERIDLYRPEARPWLPHVTVLRFRTRTRVRATVPRMGTFVPSGAAAYLSRLHPSGARYEVLDRVGWDSDDDLNEDEGVRG